MKRMTTMARLTVLTLIGCSSAVTLAIVCTRPQGNPSGRDDGPAGDAALRTSLPASVHLARLNLTMHHMVVYSPLGDGTPICDPYYTSVTPVTNEAFLSFLRDTGYIPTTVRRGWGYRVSEDGRYVERVPVRSWGESVETSPAARKTWEESPALGLEPEDWTTFMRWADCDEVVTSSPELGQYAFSPKLIRRRSLADFVARHCAGTGSLCGDEAQDGHPR